MVKFICYLMLCSISLLYCCGERSPIPENNNRTNRTTILIADEEQKFNTFKSGFDTIIKYLKNQLTIDPNLDISTKNQYQEILKKYPGFIEWLSNNPQKKKALTDAFTIVYDFLDDKKKLKK